MTPERFAKGTTFERYVADIGTPDNLAREGSLGTARKDWSAFFPQAYESAHLTEPQAQAWRWLVAQPGGPAKIVAISEEWSSDCRRDIPTVAKIAATTGMELRIFRRDGQRFARGSSPEPDAPNADLVAEFVNKKNGGAFLSIPVVAFYTRDFRHLATYIEFPAVYRKDRIVGALRAPKGGESAEQTKVRGDREFMELQASPFFRVWQCAAVDEMISMLYERLRVG